jgi:hypothetical protein
MYVVKELQTNKDLNYIDLKELDDLLNKKEKKKDLNYIDLKELDDLLDKKEKKKDLSLLHLWTFKMSILVFIILNII